MSRYKILRARRVYPIPAHLNGRSETELIARDIHHGMGLCEAWQACREGEYTGFYLASEWEKVGKEISGRLIQDPEYFERILKKHKESGEALVALSHTIDKKSLEDSSLSELLALYRAIEDAWVEHDHYCVPLWYIGGDYFNAHLVDELTRLGLSADEIAQVLMPATPSFSALEEMEIYSIAKQVLEKGLDPNHLPEDVDERIGTLVSKFYWVPFGYDGPTVYTREHYIKTIAEAALRGREEIESKILHARTFEESMRAKQKAIYQNRHVPPALQDLISIAHGLALMTDERKEFTFQSHVTFHKVLREIARRLGVEPLVLKFVMREEIEANVDTADKIKELGESRSRKLFMMHWTDGKVVILDDAAAEKLGEEVFPKVEQVTTLTGSVGSKGPQAKTTGVIRLVPHPKDMDRLSQGEILVTGMTTPEFVPAMRKSLAIITDEGGITCHAAIVSRELGIPCIIGTRIATKALKDGDIVEVDTEKGVVTKLS